MYKYTKPLFLITETPLHAGAGEGLGVVDLPIQRERHTQFPKIESSSLKGALRESFESGYLHNSDRLKETFPEIDEKGYKDAVHLAFGPDAPDRDSHAGALGFSDARLLLFPVKSMREVFAWITCPKVLRQFERDMKLVESFKDFEIEGIPSQGEIEENECYMFGDSLLVGGRYVILEEYTFEAKRNSENEIIKDKIQVSFKLDAAYEDNPKEQRSLFGKFLSETILKYSALWSEKMKTDIIILSDNDFADFVNLSTEVITRNRIDNDTGTVKSGALWNEEYLPAESILYSLVFASDIFLEKKKKEGSIFVQQKNGNGYEDEGELVHHFFEKGLDPVIQIGGNATLGKGITSTCFVSILQEISEPEPAPSQG